MRFSLDCALTIQYRYPNPKKGPCGRIPGKEGSSSGEFRVAYDLRLGHLDLMVMASQRKGLSPSGVPKLIAPSLQSSKHQTFRLLSSKDFAWLLGDPTLKLRSSLNLE